jgi:hypothetical protein
MKRSNSGTKKKKESMLPYKSSNKGNKTMSIIKHLKGTQDMKKL